MPSLPDIPDATLESVWQEVAQLPGERVPEEMERVGRSQPDLMAFVLAATDGRRVEVREIAIYLFYVLVRIFECGTARPIPPIPDADLHRQFKQNVALVKRSGGEQRWFENQAAPDLARHAPVVQSLIRALQAEAQGGEGMDEPGLRSEEVGALFFALRTVVDALQEARAALVGEHGEGRS